MIVINETFVLDIISSVCPIDIYGIGIARMDKDDLVKLLHCCHKVRNYDALSDTQWEILHDLIDGLIMLINYNVDFEDEN